MSTRLASLVILVTACGGYEVRGPALVQDPQAVRLEAAIEHGVLPAGQASEVVVRLRLRAPEAELLGRPAVNLALVVDTSHSMEGQAIEDIKTAALTLVDALQPGDRLALVVFHSKTEVLVPSTVLGPATVADIKRRIGKMKAWGTTDLAGGLAAGLDQVRQHFVQSGINRVVLLGDGVPNDASNIVPLAQAAGDNGVAVTALGFGLDYDETLMAQIAERSGGRFHFIERSTEVATVFKDEVLRLEKTVAKNMMVTITPGPGMVVTRIIGHPVAGAPGRKVAFGVGSLSTGQTRDLVIRLQATGHRPDSVVEVLDAELAFQEVLAGAGVAQRHVYVGARASADLGQVRDSYQVDVSRSAARMEAADAVIQSIGLARGGQVAEAKALLVKAEGEARASAKKLEDASLVAQADQMPPLRDALPSLVAAPPTKVISGGVPSGEPASMDTRAPSVVKRSHDAATSILQGD